MIAAAHLLVVLFAAISLGGVEILAGRLYATSWSNLDGRLDLWQDTMRISQIVWVQNPVRLDEHSELQPDVALLTPRADFFADAHPGPADIILIVEVVDTTARYDREVKLPIYARAQVPEVWVIDLPNDRIEIHTRPSPQGYGGLQQVQRDDRVPSTALPEIELLADDILGRRR